MRPTTALAVDGTDTVVAPRPITRRELRPDDVAVRVDWCGVCHTDLHALRGREAGAPLLVPGHEATGTVLAVGAAVTEHAVGDVVAVGNIVDSCGECPSCLAGQQNWCTEFPTLTYGGVDRVDGTPTLGLWAGEVVIRERLVHPLPGELDAAAVAPLLCAGATVWEPLRSAGVGPGSRVAVVGIGGLGHLAVKFAAALGAEVTVLSRSADKADDARALGATALVVSTDEAAMAAVADTFDLVVDTVAVPHDLGPLLRTVAVDGVLCSLGDLGPVTVQIMDLLVGRKKLTSSGSAGLPSTREMLAFCAEHGVTADVEVLPAARVQEALDRLAVGDVRHRFVLDTSALS
ncbi:NAD(P)-dependent alcohol dehydrogenase [Klenkia terrae]